MFPKGRKQMAVLTLVSLLGVSVPAAGAGYSRFGRRMGRASTRMAGAFRAAQGAHRANSTMGLTSTRMGDTFKAEARAKQIEALA